jgi:hypothetical protein
VREESLLEDMRAAVRGDRQRAAERRAESTPEPPPAQPVANEPEVELERDEKPGWLARLRRST